MVLKKLEVRVMAESNPLDILLNIKLEHGVNVDDDLIRECYELQHSNQYNKDRNYTIKKMEVIIEEYLLKTEGSKNL